MTIVELREKRAKLWATMEGFLDTHRNDKGVLSSEDDTVYANMEKELNDLTNEVRRMERRDAMAAELAPSSPRKRPAKPRPAERRAPTVRTSVGTCAASSFSTMSSLQALTPTADILCLRSLKPSSWTRSKKKM